MASSCPGLGAAVPAAKQRNDAGGGEVRREGKEEGHRANKRRCAAAPGWGRQSLLQRMMQVWRSGM